MTTVVLDSADLVESVTTGVIPVPKGIAEDNASQAAKKGEEEDPVAKLQAEVEKEKAAKKEKGPNDGDDEEGEDGLTPRQKREFTKAMLATIAKKHRAQKEAEEFATNVYNQKQLADQRAENLARELAALKEATKPPAVEVKAPERKDFESDQAFQDAVIDYRVDQKLKAQQAENAKREEENRQKEVLQHAAARIERAIELVADFKDVTEAADMIVPPAVAGYMQESDMFAELGYHLAKNPEVLEKLQSLSPARALVEIGKIESTLTPFAKVSTDAKVSNGAKPSQETVTPSTETGSAPSKPRIQAPILRPLNTGSASQVEKDEADMTGSQVITSWQKKHGVVLTARKRH
jgi:hypothetical protein